MLTWKFIWEIRVKNKFYLNKGNYFRIEHRPNKLVVYDKEARVAISLEFLNPSTFKLWGHFYLRYSVENVIDENGPAIFNRTKAARAGRIILDHSMGGSINL